LIQIKYFPGDTLLHKLDPRTKFLLLIFFIFIEVAFLDIRILAIPFVASIVLYLSARIPFREVKSTWKFLLVTIVVIASVNTFFTLLGARVAQPHVIGKFWVFTATTEGIFLAIAAIMRFLCLATVSLSVIMTTDPAVYAPGLAKLGFPYKGASVIDLSLRYLPTYVNELEATMNAQMARGYKTRAGGGLFSQILNTIPLLLPVTINATLSIYDVADAMELRAFGAKKQRTWYRTVQFSAADYLSLVIIACCLVLAGYLRTQFSTYWIPT
jgi:energy-coupling factor transport system permease protein